MSNYFYSFYWEDAPQKKTTLGIATFIESAAVLVNGTVSVAANALMVSRWNANIVGKSRCICLSSYGFYLHCAGELALRQAAVAPEVIIKMNLGWIFSDNFLNQSGMVERLIKERVMQPYPLTEASFINQSNVGKVFDAGDWLGKITRPCLVIGADEDRICPEKMVHELAQTIPQAQYFCFTGGVGHLPYIEQPEKFSEVILRFIGRVK